jgi:hypothetical protein
MYSLKPPPQSGDTVTARRQNFSQVNEELECTVSTSHVTVMKMTLERCWGVCFV